jgi:Domain of unknown function (DUF5666)
MTMSSQDFHRIGRPGRVCFRTLLFVLALGGCSGGVDSGGTGAPASSASASGPITGFGSVIVNAVHFDDSSASITDADGTVRSRDDLKLGMTTDIRGSGVVVDSSGAHSTATRIVYGSDILGPIDNIDRIAKTLVVLGQTVDVTPTTVFDSSLIGGLAALSDRDMIEVYALFDAFNNHYSATRIERKTSFPAYRLRGVVSNLNTATKAFKIGSEIISYAGVPTSDVPAALANGRFVRARLQIAPSGQIWLATRLQDGVQPLEDRDEARVEGLISDFTSSTLFSVEGISVDASRASVAGNIALGLGIRVAVRGTASGRVLLASEVQIKTESDIENEGFELDGSISTIDTTSQNFVLRGVTVDYSGSVEFRDGMISDLAVGKHVEVKGTLSADSTGLQATRIRFRP